MTILTLAVAEHAADRLLDRLSLWCQRGWMVARTDLGAQGSPEELQCDLEIPNQHVHAEHHVRRDRVVKAAWNATPQQTTENLDGQTCY